MNKNTPLQPEQDAVETGKPMRKRRSKNRILALSAAAFILFVMAIESGLLGNLFSLTQVNAGTAGNTKVRVDVDSAFVNGVLKLDIRGAYAANLNHHLNSGGSMSSCGFSTGADKKPVLLPEVKPLTETEVPKEEALKTGIALVRQKEIQAETMRPEKKTASKQVKGQEKKKGKETLKIEKEQEEEVVLLSTTAGKKNEAGLRYQFNKKMKKDMSEEEYTVLCRIVEAEATGEDVYGKILVANVVLNRVNSKQFPNTVEKVVFEKSGGHYQFSPTRDGRFFSVKVSKSTKEAVARALSGEDYSGGALYFFARSLTSAKNAQWFDSLDFIVKYGCHEFFG